jgi:membrane protease YdiL (CAAX protease family)
MAGTGAARWDPIAAEARRLLRTRLNLWSVALAFPFSAATAPVLFYALRGTSPESIGFTRRRFARNALAGVIGWLLITPMVFIIFWLVQVFYRLVDPDGIQTHALTSIATAGLTVPEWALLVFSAVVAAPVMEETVFRGVLQPWFAGLPRGGLAAMAAAFAIAILFRQTQFAQAWRHSGEGMFRAAAPALFILALVPPYLVVFMRPGWPDSPAIFGTSALFASMHANIWPTPVPLFILGAALGTIRARTGSLVGPIVLHALFNTVTVVSLIRQ